MANAALKMTNESDDLIIQYQKYVHAIAKKMIASLSLPAENFDEMISAGYLGLVEAAGRYDRSSKSSFKNFAFLRIRGAIIDSIRSNSELSGKAYKLARAWEAVQCLEENYTTEFNKNVARPEKLLANIFEFAASGALAFKFSINDFEEEASEAQNKNCGEEDKFILKQERLMLKKIIAKLPEIESYIINAYYFEEKSFAEITKELDGPSKGWVSRLHTKALSRLKDLITEYRKTGNV